MKFIVAQIGARHHYAIPRMLSQAGMLESFYTDSCANRGVGQLISWFPEWMCPTALNRLRQRRVIAVPEAKVRSTDSLLLNEFLKKIGFFRTELDRGGNIFARRMKSWGVGSASGIYSMFGEGIDFLRHAKRLGVKIVVEIFITPIAHRIVAAERRQFPDWEHLEYEPIDRIEEYVRGVIDVADLLVCPGENVVDGLRCYSNLNFEKVRVVPYGCGAQFQNRKNIPIPGRILFAGTADLRKGIHYFAGASKQIGDKSGVFEFRVAGNVSDRIRSRSETAHLKFLGRVSRSRMVEELLAADVLVLPTLAEGSPSVISEALMAGLPVITTASAGSVVRAGIEGIIVPERDEQALAEAILEVVSNRGMREQMARNALNRSSFVSESSWGERLIAALTSS